MSLAKSLFPSTSKLIQCRACQFARRSLSNTAIRFPRQYTPFKAAEPPVLSNREAVSTISKETLPWYIDQAYIPKPLSQARATSEPPSDFPPHLQEFYRTLSGLPFFKETIAVENESGVWQWTVVCVLREGRERNLRAAAGRVRDEVSIPEQIDAVHLREYFATQAHQALKGRPERKELHLEGVNVPEPSWAREHAVLYQLCLLAIPYMHTSCQQSSMSLVP